MPEMRSWESWDRPGVAAAIDGYWREDPTGFEDAHRQLLARLVGDHVSSATERVLEVGSGSGLVYAKLVPAVIPDSSYVGIDVSSEMLKRAQERFPAGQFLHGDVFALDFPDNAFDVVACFEVLVHLPDIHRPVAEMIRVASKLVVFTVWVAPPGAEETRERSVDCGVFLYRRFAPDDVIRAIRAVPEAARADIEVRTISGSTWAFVVRKGTEQSSVRYHPLPGLVDLLRERSIACHAALNRSMATLADRHVELDRARAELAACSRDLRVTQDELQRYGVAPHVFRGLLGRWELSAEIVRRLRSRGVTRVLERLLGGRDLAWDALASLPEAPRGGGHEDRGALDGPGLRLVPGVDLRSVPFVAYPIEPRRPNLSSILLVPDVEAAPSTGEFGIELLSPERQILVQVVVPASDLVSLSPVRFELPPVRDSDRGGFWLRVFARDVDVPVRVLEWRRPFRFGRRAIGSLVLCSLLYDR